MIKSDKLFDALRNFRPMFWPALPGRKNNRNAAVMVPIVFDKDWYVIMTLRSRKLKDHAGEMCFPGGKSQAGDRNLMETAIRETQEEIGWSNGCILGRLSSVPLYTSDFRLEPFVGLYPNQKLKLSADEVDCAVLLSLTDLVCHKTYDGVVFNWPGYGSFTSPVFFPEKIMKNAPTSKPIYGGTAHVLWELISIVCEAAGTSKPTLLANLERFP